MCDVLLRTRLETLPKLFQFCRQWWEGRHSLHDFHFVHMRIQTGPPDPNQLIRVHWSVNYPPESLLVVLAPLWLLPLLPARLPAAALTPTSSTPFTCSVCVRVCLQSTSWPWLTNSTQTCDVSTRCPADIPHIPACLLFFCSEPPPTAAGGPARRNIWENHQKYSIMSFFVQGHK